jgi:ferritin-like metal-binding protein YciE
MENNDLKGLFKSDLRYMYYVEKEIVKALPDIADASSDPELKKAFVEHLEQSKTHLERLEKIFEELDLKPRAKKSHGIGGLIKEGKEVLEKKDDISPDIVDAALIADVQRIEHYEIAAYGTLNTYAKLLGDTKTAGLLKKTLDEESAADARLTRIAVKRVNPKIS